MLHGIEGTSGTWEEEVARVVPSIDLKAFFDSVRGSLFGGSMTPEQVDGQELLLQVCADFGLDPYVEQTAYVLASVYWETGQRMQPVRETFANSDEQAIARLDRAWAKGQLGWVSEPYWRLDSNGKAWFGRGHIQLTHPGNYRRQQNKLKDLPQRPPQAPWRVYDDPSNALHPFTGALIAVGGMRDGDFTGKKLKDYITSTKVDYADARRIVNGTDRAREIAGYAKKFEVAIRAAV